MNHSKKYKLLMLAALVGAGILGRLMPHAWNLTPVTAIILFASANLGLSYALAAVAALMFLSDLSLGFYDWHVMLAVYFSFAIAALVGVMLRRNKNMAMVGLGAASSSILFFIITNWAVWLYTPMYPHTLSGLMQSYLMAVPFFRNAFVGDLLYTGFFFGAYAFIERSIRERRQTSVAGNI